MALPKAPLYNKIFEILRDRIIYMEYPPEMSLSEKDLCKELKVSRTPLREAMRKLEDMKLVNVIPRFGTHVSPIDINELRCAFEVKIKLDGLAGALAAQRITVEKLKELSILIKKAETFLKKEEHRKFIEIDACFHEIILESTQNQILQEFLSNLHYRCARLWNSALQEMIPTQEIISQLKEIFIALENSDSKKAARLLESHVQYFIDKIKTQLL